MLTAAPPRCVLLVFVAPAPPAGLTAGATAALAGFRNLGTYSMPVDLVQKSHRSACR
jgi:hypothetical protein